jgi:outer membrane immunogenic protein
MRNGLVFGVSAALLSVATPALCADWQPNLPEQAPAVAPASYFSWTGCYVGAQAGGGWGHHQFANLTGTDKVTLHTSGFLGGGQLGCNYQLPLHLVVGIEGAGMGADIKGSLHRILSAGSVTSDQTFHVSTDWLASETGRIGYDWNRWLLYVKGGAAWARHSAQIHIVNCIDFNGSQGCATGQDSHTRTVRPGWTIGAGLEWAFWDNWSARLEYDFYDFGNRVTAVNPTLGPIPVDVERNVHTVTLGVNYRFWSFPATSSPVIAKN